ncbi:MAG: response regulator transcription factor [Pseudomonadota bacterium]|nr:response regulator transcription factor [Pseudomonadota bacterium]
MKVHIIDDHALFREGLRYLLRSMTDDLEYVEAENLKRLPDLSREHPEVDLILLDLNIGGTDGLVAIGDLQTLWQETPIVNVTASERQEDIERGMAAGAASFIPKTVSSDAMVSALERVARGESYVPDLSKASGEAEKMVLRAPMTNRQMDILRLLAIGKHLDIAENTVRVHLSAIFKNPGVKTRTEAVFVAVRNGMVTIPV